MAAVVSVVLHEYVPPPLAVRVILVTVQLNWGAEGVMTAAGKPALCVTTTVAVFEQPFAALVTVTV